MNKIRLIESLKDLVGFHIGIYSNDGNHTEGILTDVKNDFITIKNEKNETFFFNIDRIQAFSKNTKKFKAEKHDGAFHEQSLMELIRNYKYSWVTIYCPNNLSFSGVLSIIADDHIILTIKEDRLFIQKEHIISFHPETLKESIPSHKHDKDEKKQDDKQGDKKEDRKEKKQEKEQKQDNSKNKQDKDEDRKENDSKKNESKKTNEKNDKDLDNKKSKKTDRETVSKTFKKIIKENLNSFDVPFNYSTNNLGSDQAKENEKKNEDKKDNDPSKTNVQKTALNDKKAASEKKREINNETIWRISTQKSKVHPKVKDYYGISHRNKSNKKKRKK